MDRKTFRFGASKQIESTISQESITIGASEKDILSKFNRGWIDNCVKMNRSFQMGNFSFTSEPSEPPVFDSTPEKRRKFSTKDCQECQICSDDVFQVSNM